MPKIIFTVTTEAYVVRLYHRESGGGPIPIDLVDGIAEKELPAGSTQAARLFLHGGPTRRAQLKIEQQTANGKLVLVEQEVVAGEDDYTSDVPFQVGKNDCR